MHSVPSLWNKNLRVIAIRTQAGDVVERPGTPKGSIGRASTII